MVHILYIEDEIDIGSWVRKDLTERGYEVTWLKIWGGCGKVYFTSGYGYFRCNDSWVRWLLYWKNV